MKRLARVLWSVVLLSVCTTAHATTWHVPSQLHKASATDTFAYVDKVTDGNLLGLNITNYGFFGDDFVTRAPSMEYPLGSEVDHLTRAGLWVGAVNVMGDTLVSTGAMDGYWRMGGASVTEFTPRTLSIRERSSLISRPTYHPESFSEQDFYAVYDDLGLRPPGPSSVEPHQPLGVKVTQNSYLWSYESANNFVIVSFDLQNVSGSTLSNVYVGLFSELASGWKGAYERWPPTGWFRNKIIYFEEEYSLLAEHRTDFGGGTAPQWAGIKCVGAEPLPDDPPSMGHATVAFNWWDWDPGSTERDEDRERYLLMSNGEVDDVTGVGLPGADDPVELISIGPFENLPPDSTIEVVLAFMGGNDMDHLRTTSMVVQDIYEAELTLGVFQNPYLTQYLDLYAVGSEDLDSASVTLKVDNQLVSITRLDDAGQVWAADYELTSPADTIAIVCCASNTFANTACDTAVFSASLVSAAQGGLAMSPDARMILTIGPGVLERDSYVLVLPSGLADRNTMNVASLSRGASAEHGFSYRLSPEGILAGGPATIEFHYRASDVGGQTPDHLRIEQMGADPLETFVDPDRQIVTATISDLGTFRLAVGSAGSSQIVDPGYLRVEQNFPNPFSPVTTIRFEIRARQRVTASVYDVRGRCVAHVLDNYLNPGTGEIVWNGKSDRGDKAAPGLYFCRIHTEHEVSTKKMLLIR